MNKPLLKRLLKYGGYLFLSIFLFFLAVDWNFLYLFGASPGMKQVRHPRLAVASEIYTADSILIGRFFKENRTPVGYDELSPNLVDALIATEDVRFYKHNGIDVFSFFSSIWSTAQGEKRGGSTLTQQLAKNLFKTRESKSNGLLGKIPGLRTLIPKIKEWNTSLKLEYVYTKNDLIALYFNTVSFGNNTYGIKVAAHRYFNKDPKNLSATEAALLVGMLKATSTYNPLTNPDAALERRNTVLGQLVKYEKMDSGTYALLRVAPLGLQPAPADEDNFKDSYLRGAVASHLATWCKENDIDLYADGLKIYTTIDSRLQGIAEEVNKKKMQELQRRFNSQWGSEAPWQDDSKKEIPDFLENKAKRLPQYRQLLEDFSGDSSRADSVLRVKRKMKVFTWKGDRDTTFSTYDSLRYYITLMHSGMMAMDPYTGHIKVWIGGNDHTYFKYDHVNQARRQPGSTFKPFAYLTALESGYTPCDRFYDVPVTIKYTENGEKKSWSPHNSDWVFTGRHMSLRWAMGRSCNSITAQITEKVGWGKVVEYAQKLGITSPLANVPSICLGSSEVTLYEMVSAYSTFLNGGKRCNPMLVTHISDREDNEIVHFDTEAKPTISEETAFLMLHMFKGGIEEPGGTSQALWEYDLFRNGNDIGGKTGTSSNHSDGWYIGLTKDLVTGVWVGAEEPSIHFKTSETGEGSKTALPIFGKFMEACYKDPATGITFGKYPAPAKKPTRKYICPNATPKDTTEALDSTMAE